MITLANWRERMSEDMRLHDLRPRTIGSYSLAVRLFLESTGTSPEDATEEDVRKYVLHLRDQLVQAPSSINIAVCALRFFFMQTLGREYGVFDLMRVNKPQTLPKYRFRGPRLYRENAVSWLNPLGAGCAPGAAVISAYSSRGDGPRHGVYTPTRPGCRRALGSAEI